MKKILAIALTVILVVALFAGCAKAGANAVVGKWAWEYEGLGEVMSVTFNNDGTGEMESFGETMEFTYSVTADKINMTLDGESSSCEYSIDGNVMTLVIEGEALELNKK